MFDMKNLQRFKRIEAGASAAMQAFDALVVDQPPRLTGAES